MGNWSRGAACAGMDPELWFPISENPKSPLERDRTRIAVETCNSCPVRQPCLEYAARTGQSGIWGGTTESWRRNSRSCRRLRHDALAS